jgi:hypothetical protein
LIQRRIDRTWNRSCRNHVGVCIGGCDPDTESSGIAIPTADATRVDVAMVASS